MRQIVVMTLWTAIVYTIQSQEIDNSYKRCDEKEEEKIDLFEKHLKMLSFKFCFRNAHFEFRMFQIKRFYL